MSGRIYEQPNSTYSRVEDDVVILENVRGELARYSIITSEDGATRLRWLEDERGADSFRSMNR